MGCRKPSTTFLTLSQRVKAYLLLRYCIKNQSVGVSNVALVNLFCIFEFITTGPFRGLLSADCPDVEKVPEFL